MNTERYALIFFSLFVFLLSCKKQTVEDFNPKRDNTVANCLINNSEIYFTSGSESTIGLVPSTYSFNFDTQKRINKISLSSNQSISKIDVEYLEDEIRASETVNGKLNQFVVYELDSDSRIKKMTFPLYQYNLFYKFYYDETGFLSKFEHFTSDGLFATYFYSYSNGNLKFITHLNKSGNQVKKTELLYTDFNNVENFFLESTNSDKAFVYPSYLRSFMGKQSKNLPRSITSYDLYDNKLEEILLNYHVDSFGNVVKYIRKNLNGQVSILVKKYKCD